MLLLSQCTFKARLRIGPTLRKIFLRVPPALLFYICNPPARVKSVFHQCFYTPQKRALAYFFEVLGYRVIILVFLIAYVLITILMLLHHIQVSSGQQRYINKRKTEKFINMCIIYPVAVLGDEQLEEIVRTWAFIPSLFLKKVINFRDMTRQRKETLSFQDSVLQESKYMGELMEGKSQLVRLAIQISLVPSLG